ncbi:NADH-quinone oxidoreductase subunit C [Streptomyces laurentii]|uniref:NADH-quinone oxidoreductase subunit C n=1 Tax=Streptomyces laurentii TaxID=39478 RepID=UPI0036A3AB58
MNGYDENAFDALPDSVTELFGEEAAAQRGYDLLTVDVPTGSWIAALEIARDKLGLTFFDWLSAVDEPGAGFRVCAHVASVGPGGVRRLLLRTTVPHEAASLPSAVEVYAGAAWHERETYEMFGVTFTDHPHLVHLLLPETFEGHPLRKDFVLAARVAKAWPGAKEPGESHDPNAPKRRQMLPPGVPDPNEWGPLKGQLPPAPARAARGAGAGAAAGGERPVRRTRTAGAGSASQRGEGETPAVAPRRARSASEGSASQQGTETSAAGPRRARSASGGSASQRPEPSEPPTVAEPPAPPAGPRRNRSASSGSASQRPEPSEQPTEPPTEAESPAPPAGPRRNRSAGGGSASQRETGTDAAAPRPEPGPRTRSADAPWHHARPAFDEGAEAPEKAPGKADEKPAAPDEKKPPTPETPPTPDTASDGGDPA